MNANLTQNSKDRLAADQRANEPSMEEILASIRRIISDGEPRMPAHAAAERRAETPSITTRPAELQRADSPKKEDTVVSMTPLRSSLPVTDSPAYVRETTAPLPEPTAGASMKPEFSPQPRVTEKGQPAAPSQPQLLSTTSNQAVSGAFSALNLARTIHDNLDVDEFVKDLLRPMLKVWLDQNLPTLVEKLVRAEIERVARGG